eukprot:TRINITY_DN7355_c0_g2_i1.p5 TRINITY_DN7355_c0_g2~~TRINITY_DN7355_c0_g2_i1.p5  ORF type:complete len:103 (+),score=14.53 TRINITY_DN7355_c0_g2_i1:40-348(+)
MDPPDKALLEKLRVACHKRKHLQDQLLELEAKIATDEDTYIQGSWGSIFDSKGFSSYLATHSALNDKRKGSDNSPEFSLSSTTSSVTQSQPQRSAYGYRRYR